MVQIFVYCLQTTCFFLYSDSQNWWNWYFWESEIWEWLNTLPTYKIYWREFEKRKITFLVCCWQHDKRLESRFRCLEERAFHHINEEVTQADKISLQEDRLVDKVYRNVPSECKCEHHSFFLLFLIYMGAYADVRVCVQVLFSLCYRDIYR